MSDIVNKLWGFCHTLRHDGIDYGDYIEQLTYLLFLKMSDERGVQVRMINSHVTVTGPSSGFGVDENSCLVFNGAGSRSSECAKFIESVVCR